MAPSRAYHSNTKHQFCMNSGWLPLRPFLYLRKNSKWNTKVAYLSLKKNCLYVNIISKFKFNSIKSLLQYHQTSVLHELSITFFKAYFTFEKKFQTLQQISAFFLDTHLIKLFLFLKFWIQTNQKSITVIQDISST